MVTVLGFMGIVPPTHLVPLSYGILLKGLKYSLALVYYMGSTAFPTTMKSLAYLGSVAMIVVSWSICLSSFAILSSLGALLCRDELEFRLPNLLLLGLISMSNRLDISKFSS